MALTEQTQLSDTNWVDQAFFPRAGSSNSNAGPREGLRNVYQTPNQFKFADTSFGGHRCINVPYGFTETCDIVSAPLGFESAGDIAGTYGLGDYWDESVNENLQEVTMQFGVARFNSLGSYFTSAYSIELATMTNTGYSTVSKLAYRIGQGLAFMYSIPFQAIAGAYSMVRAGVDFLTRTPSSKFMYMEPKMSMYLSMVSYLSTQAAVNLGFTDPVEMADVSIGPDGVKYASPTGDLDVASYLPDLFVKNGNGRGGSIDIVAVATKYQRIANRYRDQLTKMSNNWSIDYSSRNNLRESMNAGLANINLRGIHEEENGRDVNIFTLLDRMYSTLKDDSVTDTTSTVEADTPATPKDSTANSTQSTNVTTPSLYDIGRAELSDGAQFVTFAIDPNPEVSESFSVQTGPSQLAESLNSTIDSARQTSFSFAGGNLGDNFLADSIEGAMSAVKALLDGALSSFGLEGLSNLSGTSLFDLPDMITGVDAELPSASFSITLAGAYGDKMSVYIDKIIPLLYWVCAVIPRSTGHSTYAMPFLCRAYSKGRFDIKTGVVKSVNIRRFTGNRAETIDKLPTRIVLDVVIQSLDKVMHAPIENSILNSINNGPSTVEDSMIADYLNAITAVDLYDMIYVKTRLRRSVASMTAQYKQSISPFRLMSTFGTTWTGQMLSAMSSNAEI